MLEHGTAMIGLPLRLLAREVYDRLTARVGESAVALVTGEERRVPPTPRYWVCTVEAMPEGRAVDFVAIDEVQLAGHDERGHVFTDRLLHHRGRLETWFMGAETMRPLVERLVPLARIERRPRLSTLSDARSLTLAELPPRSAVVAFSAERVYALAERLKAKRGGAAVVLGALSPRTRNAQVALYQAGEVDYLVATDAIGMGLNMDVDCVAFADLRKFDGRRARDLEDAELAQIAGRAGRHARDGRFATLAPLPPLHMSTSRALEQHRFPAQRRLWWRNRDLDFASPEALLASLRVAPRDPCLRRAEDADDVRALARLLGDPDVTSRVRDPARLGLLWSVCRVPDFRQLGGDDHVGLLGPMFLQLCGPTGRLDPAFVARHVERLDHVGGDLDALLLRMASVRTWTYIAEREAWLADADAWQERARAIEDRLGDALHEALVGRFVGSKRRGTSRVVAAKAPGPSGRALAEALRAKGFAPTQAMRAAPPTRDDAWALRLVEATHAELRLDAEGRICTEDADTRILARLGPGADLRHPEVILTGEAASLAAGTQLQLRRRLLAWTRDLVPGLLAPLRPAPEARLSSAGRGLLYQIEQGLGTALASEAREQLELLEGAERQVLQRLGVRLGRHVLFAAALLSPEALRARGALCAAHLRSVGDPGARLPIPGVERSLPVMDGVPVGLYTALGFPAFGPLALRADLVEEVARLVAKGARDASVASRCGCAPADVPDLRAAFGAGSRGRRAGTR
jgi:ATP-dependent RNA helicase SUPV3L1/SUV3